MGCGLFCVGSFVYKGVQGGAAGSKRQRHQFQPQHRAERHNFADTDFGNGAIFNTGQGGAAHPDLFTEVGLGEMALFAGVTQGLP